MSRSIQKDYKNQVWREFPQFPQFPKPENQGFSTVPDSGIQWEISEPLAGRIIKPETTIPVPIFGIPIFRIR